MAALQNLTQAITNLTAAVALIPSGTTGAGGATEAQVQSAADAVNAQTALITAAVGSTPAGGLAVPAGLAATVPTPGSVALAFSPVPGAITYNIKRAPTTGGPYTTLANIPGTTFVDTGLPVGTPVFYVVSSVNTATESANSAQVTATP